jgi:single-stranded-DNA-specific exonuclease
MTNENLFAEYQNQRWSFSEFQDSDVKNVADYLKIDDIHAKVLIHNVGCSDAKLIKSILRPDKKYLNDFTGISSPEELKKAIDRIQQAHKNQDHVLINGDPDADGTSGTTILVAGLRQMGIKTSYMFPIRPIEGHGLQLRIIDEAKKSGISLIITTDCGTKDIEAVAYANDCGIDVIITDHHILGHTLPQALAIINPFMCKEESEFKSVSGATIAYKFIQALYSELKIDMADYLEDLGLIVSAFGSLSDRVSLLNPINRLIIEEGVNRFISNDREGIIALRELSKKRKGDIKSRHLTRTVIPLLNAPGRIGNPFENIPDSSIIVDLLLLGKGKRNRKKAKVVSTIFRSFFSQEQNNEEETAVNQDQVNQTVANVDTINEKRKRITAKIEDQIDECIANQVNSDTDKIIIVQGDNWNSGVIGIDTDRLKERFLKPAIILTSQPNSDYIRGSSRSIPRINIYRIIEKVEDVFIQTHNRKLFCNEIDSFGKKKIVHAFGGHSQACGFTLHKNDVPEFIKKLREFMNDVPSEQFEYHYDIIDKLELNKINLAFINSLEDFAPYGQQFDYPIFYLEDCMLHGGQSFGNRYQTTGHQHVRFEVSETNTKVNRTVSAIGFGLWKKYCYIRENCGLKCKVNLVFTLEIDSRGKKRNDQVLLNVLDIRVSDSSH